MAKKVLKRVAPPRVRKRRKHGVTLWLYDHFVPHAGNGHEPHYFRTGSLIALALGVLMLQGLYLGATKFVFLQTNFLASVLPGVLVSLANEDRAENGVGALEEDPELSAAAQVKANDMAARGYFSHATPEGQPPWYWFRLAGYEYAHAGENLAVNFTDSIDVQEAWMESPTHRANIVKPVYTKVGIGVAEGTFEGKRATFVVQFFATPPAAPIPAPAESRLAVTVAEPVPETEPVVASAPPAATEVLGTEAATPAPTTRQTTSFWQKFMTEITSPTALLVSALTGFLSLTIVALLAIMLVHFRIPHPRVVLGSAALTVLFLVALYMNASAIIPVTLPEDAGVANAISATR
ncbi:MAG: CAP domain-containing protein [Candidatus Pacebacteria bacterium]|nr:CAP domain-containing protein [Candidatus Paceibacterota bacterium]MBP9840294.1 CAP domain-containing protein [Candidatus Paceibacterota bacterium]